MQTLNAAVTIAAGLAFIAFFLWNLKRIFSPMIRRRGRRERHEQWAEEQLEKLSVLYSELDEQIKDTYRQVRISLELLQEHQKQITDIKGEITDLTHHKDNIYARIYEIAKGKKFF